MQRAAKVLAGLAPLGAGLALAALGAAGMVRGVRAELAHGLDFACRYGRWIGHPDEILAAAERAQKLYPHNFRISIAAAESAYNGRFDAAGKERPDRLAAAARWCAVGLSQNPYVSQLRMLDTRLSERRSLPEAVRKWETYVEWDCWEPHNHVVLVELYAKAGRYREAIESLALLESQPAFHDAAQRKFDEAWRGEMEAMRAMRGAPPP